MGFINATKCHSETLTHHSMSHHEPHGATLCIHSVCVSPQLRHRGIGTALLRHYVEYVVQQRPEVHRMALLCKRPLLEFYARAGFQLVGESAVSHGRDQWLEMKYPCLPPK